MRSNADDPTLVEIDQSLLGHIRDLSGYLLLAPLRVTHMQLEFLDVY